MPDISLSATDRAFRYTAATGLVELARPVGYDRARAYAISDDGTRVAGIVSQDAVGTTNRACVWINGVPTVLGILPGGSAASAAGISGDGNVVVGQCRNAGNVLQPVKWTGLGAATQLGVLNGGNGGYANAANSDGSVIVGQANDGFGQPKYVSWSGLVATALFPKPTNFNFANNYAAGDSVYFGGSEYEATVAILAPAPDPTPIGGPWTRAGINATGNGVSHDGLHTCGVTSADGLGIIPSDGSAFPEGLYNPGGQAHDANANFAGQLGTNGSSLFAISNSGAACGTSQDVSGHGQAVWYDGVTLRQLAPLAGATSGSGFAVASDGSVIAGVSFGRATTWTSTGVSSYSAAFFIGFLPGGTYSVARGITAVGTTIVGYADTNPPPPGIPSPFCGELHTGNGFTAAWTAPPGPPVPTSYTLDYRKVGDVSFTEVSGITDTSFFIGGLDPSTAYEFKVEALNGAVASGFSPLVQCSTDGPILEVALPPTLHRWRGQVGINWRGMALVGDAFSNVLGLSDFNAFTEYGNTMQFLITTPPLHEDRKRIFMPRFEIEVEAGAGNPNAPATPPVIMLRWSKDGGKTWSSLQPFRSMGTAGEFVKRLRWLNLGNARTWIFELSCTDPVRRVIIGTYADTYKGLG